MRVIIHTQTLFGSGSFSSYIPIETVNYLTFERSNPWGLLVLAGISVLGGVVWAAERPVAIVGGVFFAVVFVVIWYFLKTAGVWIGNSRATFRITSRSEGKLANLLRHIDNLRLGDAVTPQESTEQPPLVTLLP